MAFSAGDFDLGITSCQDVLDHRARDSLGGQLGSHRRTTTAAAAPAGEGAGELRIVEVALLGEARHRGLDLLIAKAAAPQFTRQLGHRMSP